jgi:hypothetical protein
MIVSQELVEALETNPSVETIIEYLEQHPEECHYTNTLKELSADEISAVLFGPTKQTH